MRRSFSLLVGTSILALLVGPNVATAQDAEDAEQPPPIVVSGTLDCGTGGAADPSAAPDASGVPADAVATVHEWSASDPRLSGDAAYTGRWQLYEPPAEDAAASASAVYEIVNEGGAWLCETSRPEGTSSAPEPGEQHTLVFTGEGAYAGMTAYLHVDWSQAPYAFTGLIIEGDEPAYAEPQG